MDTTLPTHTGPFNSVPLDRSAMAIMGQNGDTKHLWNKSNPAEVEAAKMLFDHLVGVKKYLAFKVRRDGEQGQQVKVFSPKADGYIFAPPMQGG
jgi:hypothetical protein